MEMSSFERQRSVDCTEKKVSDIPVSSRYVTYQTLSGWEELNYSCPFTIFLFLPTGRVW